MSQTLTIDQRIEVPRRFMAEVFNGHDAERARDFFTADVALARPVASGPSPGWTTSWPSSAPSSARCRTSKPRSRTSIASGDLVALRLVVTATQTGDLLGIPASGRDVRWDAVDIYRVTDDGKISEQWAFEDMAAIGSQLGAFSLPWAN